MRHVRVLFCSDFCFKFQYIYGIKQNQHTYDSIHHVSWSPFYFISFNFLSGKLLSCNNMELVNFLNYINHTPQPAISSSSRIKSSIFYVSRHINERRTNTSRMFLESMIQGLTIRDPRFDFTGDTKISELSYPMSMSVLTIFRINRDARKRTQTPDYKKIKINK